MLKTLQGPAERDLLYVQWVIVYKWCYQTFWLNIMLVDGQIYAHNLKDPAERDLPYQLIN